MSRIAREASVHLRLLARNAALKRVACSRLRRTSEAAEQVGCLEKGEPLPFAAHFKTSEGTVPCLPQNASKQDEIRVGKGWGPSAPGNLEARNDRTRSHRGWTERRDKTDPELLVRGPRLCR